MKKVSLSLLWVFLSFIFAKSEEQTIGLFLNSPDSYDGYTLFAPLPSTDTYLIDNCGYLVKKWSGEYKPGHAVYLLEDGSLLRTGVVKNQTFGNVGGLGGIIRRYDWDGNLIWSYQMSDETQTQHHDVAYLPNGNVLAIAWDVRTTAEAIAAGRDPKKLGSALWAEKIVEIKPIGPDGGEIVWEWKVWDRLIQDYDETKDNFGVVSEHPERININFTTQRVDDEDWLHINSVFYDETTEQIILSCHNFGEIWVIDKTTTTEEAAGSKGGKYGKGGDLLYRWGNPEAYGRGEPGEQRLFGQHDARRIEPGKPDAGKYMVYNNGLLRPDGNYSTVDVFAPPIDENGFFEDPDDAAFGPSSLSWRYQADPPEEFYSLNISGAERLANGNTIICEGSTGELFEVDYDGNLVWYYVNPVSTNGPLNQGDPAGGLLPGGNPNSVFKIQRYPRDYPAFAGKTLIPGDPIELNPLDYDCEIYTSVEEMTTEKFRIYPNPANDYIEVFPGEDSQHFPQTSKSEIRIYNSLGECVKVERVSISEKIRIDVSDLAAGVYFVVFADQTKVFHRF